MFLSLTCDRITWWDPVHCPWTLNSPWNIYFLFPSDVIGPFEENWDTSKTRLTPYP